MNIHEPYLGPGPLKPKLWILNPKQKNRLKSEAFKALNPEALNRKSYELEAEPLMFSSHHSCCQLDAQQALEAFSTLFMICLHYQWKIAEMIDSQKWHEQYHPHLVNDFISRQGN